MSVRRPVDLTLSGASLAAPQVNHLRAAMAHLARRMQARHLLVVDMIGIVAASYLALALRFDTLPGLAMVDRFLPGLALLLAVQVAVNVRFGLYTRGWRFASIPEVVRIVGAVLGGTLVAVILLYGSVSLSGSTILDGFPRSFWLAEALLAVTALGGVRFAIRAAYDWAPSPGPRASDPHQLTLLYGAGQTGVLMARAAERNPGAGVVPVGFLDDDAALHGKIVSGLRVFGGRESLAAAVEATGARTLLIAMPSTPGTVVRPVVDAALALGLEVRTVPPVTDLLDGSVDRYRLRRVRVEDLLRRPIVTEHASGVSTILHDRVVMITGAAGSIGSELARQVLALGPRTLVLVDRAESPLYMLQRELEPRVEHGATRTELRVRLANVTSREAIVQLVTAERPSVIFHAAAYKHVPMMESHPSDALYVNVVGTRFVLEAAERADVERFVLVSTDKAVRPTSVMGASKRLAEMLVAEAAQRTGRPYVSVRFGNVLGSTGSVVPIFQEQLENGEPLTVTDREMTRFFMTIPEAAWLILDACAMGRTGDLFVLDMGQPVRIMDLANDLIRLAGGDPATQPIDFVGLRPGEKLHEELFYANERVTPTQNPKVLRVAADPPTQSLEHDLVELLSLADGRSEEMLRRAVLSYVNRRDAAAPAEAPSAPERSEPGSSVPAPAGGDGSEAFVPAVN